MRLNVLALLLLLSLNANAEGLIYEDSTHLNKLICCNDSSCVILRDLNYIGTIGSEELGEMGEKDKYYCFNNASLKNVTVCYEVGNTYSVNMGDWAFMNIETVGIIGFIAVIVIITIYIILKKSSNFRK